MKKIKEGLINKEIVRRYPGSDNNGGNNVVDKGKGGGSRSRDNEKVDCWRVGGLGCKYVWKGRMLGVSSQVLWGRRQDNLHQQNHEDKVAWYT